MRITWGRAPALGVVSAVLLFGLSACGSEEEPSPLEVTQDAASEADEQDVIEAHQAFWDESIRIQNSGEVGEAALAGVASGPFLEREVAKYRGYTEMGAVRVGEPELRDFEAQVSGDTATSAVCVNENEWGFQAPGSEVDYPDLGWMPVEMRFRRGDDDRWYITEQVPSDSVAKDCAQ